jgi:NAD(P)-dependent dehydrogenase (short-subunit alcohol dehydrogenase family)
MIFITGASHGIGRLLFEHFSANGKECRGSFFSSVVHPDSRLSRVDVRSYKQIASWIDSALAEKDEEELVLCNCAGVTYNAFAHKADVQSWRDVIEVNLIGSFNAIRALLPHMRNISHGRVINFSSIVGQKGVPGTSAYAASKSGLWGMTRAIAVENAAKNITINNINLGYFDIGIIAKVPAEQLAGIVKTIPVGHLGIPDNIVKTVEFMLANGDLCGTSVDVNGGQF